MDDNVYDGDDGDNNDRDNGFVDDEVSLYLFTPIERWEIRLGGLDNVPIVNIFKPTYYHLLLEISSPLFVCLL